MNNNSLKYYCYFSNAISYYRLNNAEMYQFWMNKALEVKQYMEEKQIKKIELKLINL